jgi:hypothetical protein
MAETRIELREIPKGGKINPNFAIFEKVMVKVILEELDEYEKLFEQFTSTWKHKPKFTKKVKSTRQQISGTFTTRSKPFVYVEMGTKVRRAAMSRDFQAKSKVRSLRAGPGAGRKVGMLKNPQSGIKAREARVVIAEQRERDFAVKMTREVNRAAQQVFGGGGGIGFAIG